ncbi:MAG: ISL3 family transposase [Thermoanaerobacteraceae bacterium]|nr:ISL3 family transposase [Thermoanaerobacteraceae bacterium]
MLNSNYIQILFGIKDAIVTNIENNADKSLIDIYFELKRDIHKCPNCNELTDSIHDYRIQKIKGPPVGEKFILFHYRKRRYVCPACGKRFYENNSFVPRYHRMSSSLVSYILKELKSTSSRSSVAKRCNISVYTVSRIFDFISHGKLRLPEVISIDEFKGNAETGKYQCIITDPKNRRVLDILPGREAHHLSTYFFSFSKEERDKVKVIVIDMWKPYADMAKAYFKNAIVVIDRFHYVRQVMWAFDRIRREEQHKFSKERRRYFKRSKKLLWARFHNLSEENQQAVEVMLNLSPRLKEAFLLKEKFLEFVDASNFDDAKKKLKDWYLYVSVSDLPEFNYCFATINRWQDSILNSFKVPYTNAYTEGVNNKVKVLKRNAFGLRNFNRLRSRILYMMA